MVLEPHGETTTGFKGLRVGRLQGCPESLIMQPAVGRHRHTVHMREVVGSSPSAPIVGLKSALLDCWLAILSPTSTSMNRSYPVI